MSEARTGTRIAGGVLAFALVAGAAFAVGRFTAFDATTAPATPSTTSAEAGFARDMQVHHAQAVEMALTAYRSTENDDIRLLSYDIATSQQHQIGQMSEWLVEWDLPALGGKPMDWAADAHAGHGGADMTVAEAQQAMGMASTAELAALDAATGPAADLLFIDLMTRHHEGAIEMVDAVLPRAHDERVLSVARTMAETQQKELTVLAAMRAELTD